MRRSGDARGWLTNLLAGARAITAAARKVQRSDQPPERRTSPSVRFPWDAGHPCFTVREPFPSKTTGATVDFGRVSGNTPLLIETHMRERGVIFSDSIEADFLEFNSGTKAQITVTARKGLLVV